jgi:hypothetical protein
MSDELPADHRLSPAETLRAGTDGKPRRPRGEAADDMRPEALSAASGITDGALLGKLVAAGIDGETLTALSLVPLVAVAWADGSLDERERAALLLAAAETGLDPDGPAFRLLDGWLAHPPKARLIEAWSDYVRDRAEAMGAEARLGLRVHLLGRARRVAEAAGSALGHASPISPAEALMLARLEGVFA